MIKWTLDNEVFIARIDAEHREVFDSAEAFEQSIVSPSTHTQTQHCLATLCIRLEEHLSHEERLMQSVGYPSYDWHKQQHDTLRRRLKLFTPLISGGNREAADVFLEFLAGWLQDHTSVADRMMAAFVRNYERARDPALGALEMAVGQAGTQRPQGSLAQENLHPRIVRFCKVCKEQTTHELRSTGVICLKCVEAAFRAEMDRD